MRAISGLGLVAVAVMGCADIDSPDELGTSEQEGTSSGCVFTQGYWKSQSTWPVSSFVLGNTTYTEAQLRAILGTSVKGNGLVDLAHQLIAAKLNVASGASSFAFAMTIAQADGLVGSRVVPPVGAGFLSPATTKSLTSRLETFNSSAKDAGPCVAPGVDLAITKTVSNPQPNVGDVVTFTVTVTDNGPSTATGVTVTDLVPAGLTFISAAPSQGTYAASTGLWTIGTVTTVTPATIQVQTMVVSPSAQTNTATISHADQVDPVPGNNAASATVSPAGADLAITKTVSNPQPNVGDVITFTVTVTDNGPSAATGVTVTDLVPAGLTFVSATASQGTYVSATGLWTIGTVTTVTPATLQVQTMMVSASAQTNTATISHADQFDPNTANNTASATVSPSGADLAITKTVSNPQPNVGDVITFTVTVTDNGPSTATGVTVTDLVPAGLTFVSATPSQGTYVSATGLWTIGTVTTVTPATMQVQTMVVSPSAQTNTATISNADQFDPNTANNTASATISPTGADLAITKTVSNTQPNVGDMITFTVTVTDNGPSVATNVAVTDLLPPGLGFVSATPSQGTYVVFTGVWTIGTLTIGVPATIQVQAIVTSPSTLTNTATISDADQFDPNTANNTASATVSPSGADLAITKTVSNPQPNVGDVVTFTVTVTDNGPSTATGVTVTDLVPAGLTFVSATPSQGAYASSTGLWTIGTVTTVTPATLQVQTMMVSPSAQTNTATISHADQFDPNTANNTASATVSPSGADLAITKTVSNPQPNVGDVITFTVTVTDNGPSVATNVAVTDLLPVGLTFVSATPSQGVFVPNTGLWTIGTLTIGVPATMLVQAMVVSPSAKTNTAAISNADQFDPNTANNTASATVSPTGADLAITKTVSDASPNVGDTITFTVTVTDNGPSVATNVVVTDLVPAGFTFISASPSQGSYSFLTGLWTIGTVTDATSATLQVQVTVTTLSAVTNTAAISQADQFDPNTANNAASVTVSPH